MRASMRRRAAGAGVIVVLSLSGVADAALPPYSLVGSFDLPSGPFDVMPDGRVAYMDGHRILVQDGLNASSYSHAGSVDPGLISSFGASLLEFSPDGSRIAIGDNNFGDSAGVLLVDTASLDPSAPSPVASVAVPNFAAHWADDDRLFVNGFGTEPDLFEVNATTLQKRLIVENIGMGTGGVTADGAYLFQANGFDTSNGGEPTGEVRAFALSDIDAAAAPLDFVADGIPVADALSGVPLEFDGSGNLLVGGGDFFAGSDDFGYAAVIDGDAVAAALAGGPPAPDGAELRLSPAGTQVGYSIAFNSITEEVLVIADGTAYRYAVPAPTTGTVFCIAGLIAGRRRRVK